MHGPSKPNTTSGKLHWHRLGQIAQPQWLVKGLLPETGFALLSGKSSTGKTFIALHLVYCVATGEPFAGKKIKRCGGALLLAAEASGDIPLRLRALAEPPASTSKTLPFAWVDQVPKLSDPGALKELLALATEAEAGMQATFQQPLALIVVDTLSAAAGFNDENSAADVQPVINILHELARQTGTLVLAIDHFGKSTNAGTRGSTAKEASADAVLKLTDNYELVLSKLRMGSSGQEFDYSLQTVQFGFDADGDPISTCIINFAPQQATSTAANPWKGLEDLKKAYEHSIQQSKQQFTHNGSVILATPLEEVRKEFYRAYQAKGVKPDASRKAFGRQLNRAEKAGLICRRDSNGVVLMWTP
jgi:RecA-family ATPase